jgi:hypothetical protein
LRKYSSKKGLIMFPNTVDVYNSLMMDNMPGFATIIDFGLDGYGTKDQASSSVERMRALQNGIRSGSITIKDLDHCLGDGPALTQLVQQKTEYKNIVFHTAWDDIQDEDDERDDLIPYFEEIPYDPERESKGEKDTSM